MKQEFDQNDVDYGGSTSSFFNLGTFPGWQPCPALDASSASFDKN
jgi:hypothetical protein